MAYYIGIDGGGTKTTCVVGDETCILGRGMAGASNVVRVGAEKAAAAWKESIQNACEDAGIAPNLIARTAIGVAGAARVEVAQIVRHNLAKLVSGQVEIFGDMETGLAAAFGNGPGVIVISGTGSIAYARNASGETARVGGWGWAVSDEGSAHWIGREAIAAVLRARDRGEEVLLLGQILDFWNLSGADALVIAANATPPPNFGALLPPIVAAAGVDDPVAQDILNRAVDHLLQLAISAAGRVFVQPWTFQVAMSGGVFAFARGMREDFCNRLHSYSEGITVLPGVVDPVMGALVLARQTP